MQNNKAASLASLVDHLVGRDKERRAVSSVPLRKNESGATAIEYGLIAAGISVRPLPPFKASA
jgi:hypothetical protein